MAPEKYSQHSEKPVAPVVFPVVVHTMQIVGIKTETWP